MNTDPKSFNNPKGTQLRPCQPDDIGRAVLSLTREVCVLTDRLAILEAVLEDNGLNVSEVVDTYQPNKPLKEDIEERTARIIGDVLASLAGKDYRRS